jgi:hypothetical protein
MKDLSNNASSSKNLKRKEMPNSSNSKNTKKNRLDEQENNPLVAIEIEEKRQLMQIEIEERKMLLKKRITTDRKAQAEAEKVELENMIMKRKLGLDTSKD